MNPCQPFADAVLDDAAPRPEGFAAHLGSCLACQALRRGHRAAQTLQGSQPGRAARLPLGRVVRRAAVVFTAGAIAAVALALSRQAPVFPEAPQLASPTRALEHPPLEVKPLEAQPPDPLLALAQLSHTVTRYARVDPVAHGYGPRWRSLPLLVAPRSALDPPVVTPEELP